MTSLSKADPFQNDAPGRSWYAGFLSRNPEAANAIDTHAQNPILSTKDWFECINAFLKTEKDVFTDPRRVFTCDESTFFQSPMNNNYVVVLKYINKAYQRPVNDKRGSITLMLYASADGQIPPPCLVYPCLQTPENIMSNLPANWSCKQNVFGRMNGDIMYEYMTKVFYPWLVERGTTFLVILFMDLQSCHIDLLLSELCAEKQIILVCLVRNTLHPIDTAVLRPFAHYCVKQVPGKAYATFKMEEFAKVFDTYLQEGVGYSNLSKDIINEFRTCKLYPFGTEIVTKKYTRNKELPLESNMDVDVDLPLTIEDGTLEKDAEKNQVSVCGSTWQGGRSFSAFIESQNVVAEPSLPVCGSLQDTALPEDPLNPVTSYVVIDCGADITKASATPHTISKGSDIEKLLEGETFGKYMKTNESLKKKSKVTYYVFKNGDEVALKVRVPPITSKLVPEQDIENYQLTIRNVGSETEETMTIQGDESRDPLEILTVPGPSRLCQSFDSTVQNKQAHYSLAAQDCRLSNKASNDPTIQLSTSIALHADIKEEMNTEKTTRLPETDPQADFNIGSQDDDPESDISSDIIRVSHFCSNAAESNSDSSVYFQTVTTQKPKQKVTTELLFHRYKVKSKREIDRLHNKIRELKASEEKYKR